MNIAFKSENGSCPSFTHECIRYYINDVNYRGEREYQLFSKKLDRKEIVFSCREELKDYLDEQSALYFCSSNSFIGYENKTHLFKIEGLKVTVSNKEKAVGYSYERYADCLKRAKEFLDTIVNGDAPVQLSIWDLPNVLKSS
jgi:hypothetical protein